MCYNIYTTYIRHAAFLTSSFLAVTLRTKNMSFSIGRKFVKKKSFRLQFFWSVRYWVQLYDSIKVFEHTTCFPIGVGSNPTWCARNILRHRVFPGGPPSKYYPGPTMLNFRDQTRTGVFIEVGSYTELYALSNSSTKFFWASTDNLSFFFEIYFYCIFGFN